MKIIKQNVGADVDSKKVKVSFMVKLEDQSIKIKASRSFDNGPSGFKSMLNWMNEKKSKDLVINFTMEATGVYYENLAYFLSSKKQIDVHVLLPNIASAYSKSLNVKLQNDEIDAKTLAQLGLERSLKIWDPGSQQMRVLKKLSRERIRIQNEKTMVSNQLHAELSSYCPNKKIVKRSEQRIEFLKKQIKSIEKQMKSLVSKDGQLSEKIDNVCTAKGLGFISVVGVVAETNGFALFTNRHQLVSFAGYDVQRKTSGTSVKTKPKISKKGNSYIRRLLFLPAMSAVRFDQHHKNYYNRIVDKTQIKMKANVAIQRKLLLLIYTLFKKNEPYNPEYHIKLKQKLEVKNNENIPVESI